MAGTGDFRKLLNDVIPFPQKEFRQELVMQPHKELTVSSNMPAIQQRNGEFNILRIELVALGQGPRGWPQLQTQVPKFLTERPDRLSQGLFSASVGMQKEDVNVGVREQSTSTEAAQGY